VLFRSQALNGVDATLKSILDGIEDEEVRNEIQSIQGTEKKIPALYEKIKALSEKKANAKASDKTGLQDEINKLNAQVNAIKAQSEQEKADLLAKFGEERLNDAVKTSLAGYNYAGEIPKDVQIMTAESLLKRELGNKKVKLVRDENGQIQLKQSDNPEMDYFENNKKVNYSDMVNSVLANNKMLKVAEPVQQTRSANNAQQTANPIVNKEAETIYAQQLERLGVA
jgi:hypothetical protein